MSKPYEGAELNNAAGRLHHLLLKRGTVSGDRPLLEAWATILQVDPTERGLLLAAVGQTLSLPKLAYDATCRAIPESSHTLFLRWHPNVQAAFSNMAFQGAWSSFANSITGEDMLSLAHSSHEIARVAPEQTVPASDLEELKDQLLDLLVEVQNSTELGDLKPFLLSKIKAMWNAIAGYEYFGVAPLEEALDSTLGWFARNRRELEKRGGPESRTIFSKAWKVMHAVALVLSLATDGYQLLQIGGVVDNAPQIEQVDEPPTGPILRET
jgi:hypothetical protein